MKISTGRTARQLRRREIISRLLSIINDSTVDETIRTEARMLVLELFELSTIDANNPPTFRRRN